MTKCIWKVSKVFTLILSADDVNVFCCDSASNDTC